MDRTLSPCGLVCTDCPVYIATITNDGPKKEELSREWTSEDYSISPEDIRCYGCQTPDIERLFKLCQECEIRRRANQQSRENYAHVIIYPGQTSRCVKNNNED